MKHPIDIRQFLPHRNPMLMVDDILEMDEDGITTNFYIASDTIFLENNVFSEVGIIENAAQTCSGIVGRPQFEANNYKEGYHVQGFISKIKSFEIHVQPPVNSCIITKGELMAQNKIGTFYNCLMKSSTYYDDNLIASGVFNLIIHP